VDFNRAIRPVLAAKCYACHGPDEDKRKADQRLDTRTGATKNLGGYARWFRESRLLASFGDGSRATTRTT
jgi:hypothetical protein